VDVAAPLHRLDPGDRERLLARLRPLLAAQPQIAFAFVFGSFAEGRPFHDIDVGVAVDPAVADDERAALEGQLTEAAGFPVDLVVLNGRPVPFLFHVYRCEAIVVRDEARLTAELERTMRIYFDIEPVLRQATREAFGS
jgi:uncharacterized protein